METTDLLRVDGWPDLREPVLLAAFAGWNDAAQVATTALNHLRVAWSAENFAGIDAETFFVFSETRPMISLSAEGQRHLQWPENEFYFRVMDASERDVILMIGTEPHLRWRTFARTILQVAERLNVSCLITVGGLLADVPHTVPPRLSGFASSPGLLPRLQDLGVSLSSYEGPTGILGALHDTWRNSGRPGLSLWGSVPHYISATPNPQVTVALLRRISSLLNVELEISGLERKSQLFRQQVDEALSDNPEAQEYVRQLEERLGEETVTAPAPELIQDLEEFLRRRRDTDDAPPS